MRVLISLLVCLGMWASAACAAETVDGVRQRLVDAPVLRGQFEQVRQLQGFRNPLRSRGVFLLARDHGMLWDTREPFASRMVLTRARLLTRLPDGSTRVLLDGTRTPALSALNALLLALLAGDLEALTQQFEAEQTLNADGSWTLRLQPREVDMRKAIARVELAGDRYVRQITISEPGGDSTHIRFLELSEVPATLSSDEVAQFE
ncbi:MAG TPA: outer membrane lipoprotein carrier protein LolA [Arenimonas sp.]|nr:outer membrane lipoprotein carrier protein LolA [Arenimonas sp.]